MLEKSFSLLYFLKNAGNEPKKFIYLRITVDGVRVEISVKKQWWADRWDKEKGRAIGVKQDAQALNFFLETLESKVFNARQKLIQNDDIITSDLLRKMLLEKDDRKKILEVFKTHNDQIEALVGKDYADGTLERYKTSYDHTRAFIKWQYQQEDFFIHKLNYFFIEQYGFWLKTVRKCAHNTTMKYLANFKKIVLICVKNKWLPGDPFANFKFTKKTIIRDALNEFELKKIIKRNFENDRLNNVRDIFVFCCYTGLAYADVKKLKRSEIETGVDGEQWIFTPRQKTDTPCPIPLLPVALQLLVKYQHHPKCVNQDKVLPVLSNQKMNAYLKEIADLCGIRKILTFHLARHTFATTICLSNGVPIETVSKMLGHTNLAQTQHYAKVMHQKISVDMAAIRNKYVVTDVEELIEEPVAEIFQPVKKQVSQPKPAYNYVLVR